MSKTKFGYPTNVSCCVCGQVKNNQEEPRFYYAVCEDHQDVRPVDIPRTNPFKKKQDEKKTGHRH